MRRAVRHPLPSRAGERQLPDLARLGDRGDDRLTARHDRADHRRSQLDRRGPDPVVVRIEPDLVDPRRRQDHVLQLERRRDHPRTGQRRPIRLQDRHHRLVVTRRPRVRQPDRQPLTRRAGKRHRRVLTRDHSRDRHRRPTDLRGDRNISRDIEQAQSQVPGRRPRGVDQQPVAAGGGQRHDVLERPITRPGQARAGDRTAIGLQQRHGRADRPRVRSAVGHPLPSRAVKSVLRQLARHTRRHGDRAAARHDVPLLSRRDLVQCDVGGSCAVGRWVQHDGVHAGLAELELVEDVVDAAGCEARAGRREDDDTGAAAPGDLAELNGQRVTRVAGEG